MASLLTPAMGQHLLDLGVDLGDEVRLKKLSTTDKIKELAVMLLSSIIQDLSA